MGFNSGFKGLIRNGERTKAKHNENEEEKRKEKEVEGEAFLVYLITQSI